MMTPLTRPYRCGYCRASGHRANDCEQLEAAKTNQGDERAKRILSGLKTSPRGSWTPEKRLLITTRYAELGPTKLVELIPGETPKTISAEAARLGVQFKKDAPVLTDEQGRLYPFGLDRRDVQFIRAAVRGGCDKAAARELAVSVKYVGQRLAVIYQKMDVTCRMHMAVKADRTGLLEGVYP
jgi:hypothetical protein